MPDDRYNKLVEALEWGAGQHAVLLGVLPLVRQLIEERREQEARIASLGQNVDRLVVEKKELREEIGRLKELLGGERYANWQEDEQRYTDLQSRLFAAEKQWAEDCRVLEAENERLKADVNQDIEELTARLSVAESRVKELEAEHQLRYGFEARLKRAEAVVEAVRSVADSGVPLDASEARILIRRYEESDGRS